MPLDALFRLNDSTTDQCPLQQSDDDGPPLREPDTLIRLLAVPASELVILALVLARIVTTAPLTPLQITNIRLKTYYGVRKAFAR